MPRSSSPSYCKEGLIAKGGAHWGLTFTNSPKRMPKAKPRRHSGHLLTSQLWDHSGDKDSSTAPGGGRAAGREPGRAPGDTAGLLIWDSAGAPRVPVVPRAPLQDVRCQVQAGAGLGVRRFAASSN